MLSDKTDIMTYLKILFIIVFLLFGQMYSNAVIKDDKMPEVGNNSEPVNVKLFGAKGDGKTDDVRAIQAALNQGPGRMVFFPKGNYRISKPLNLLSGTEIVGEGDVGNIAGSSILPLNDVKTFSIFSSNTGILEDVIFRNIRTLRAKYSLSVNVSKGYVSKIKWYNCVFQEHDICLNVFGSDVNGMYANTFRDCYFKASRLGIYCQGAYNINVIQGCGFENMGNGYIKLNSMNSPNLSNSFVENRCESVTNIHGIAIDLNKNVFGFYINRNFFENSFETILKTNGARSIDFSNNTNTNNKQTRFGSLLINGGDAIIRNNFSLTGFILTISHNGFCNELTANGFLNFSTDVRKENFGIVNNHYNKKFNNQ